ncbi:hypothetical protein P3X46_009665 [Hevea brasiliensis]|uniref:acylphosphatase n=1 Tax=Hevea brasiliensis TaxID=3981 RepID=A0ABQ9MMM2_HEVBR|nr:uncharacterized protein LOC110650247 [Hevea brasiliensis]KAJ9181544.1 hypothetical protein P3X46_009665 [Hevea brasiliensis]
MPPTLTPVFLTHPRTTTKFLIFRANLRGKWINSHSHNNASLRARFSVLPNYRSYSLYSFLSLCSSYLLSCPSLRSLFQSRFPHLRSPLSSMTTPPQANSDPPQSTSSKKTVRAVIKGRVQGVFYRDWTVENATQLGLKGWVRNRRDGSVEALLSGDSDKVQEMEQRCRRGPPDAMVTGFQVFPCDDDPGTGFQRKPTV